MANKIPTSAPVVLAAASFPVAAGNRFIYPQGREAWYHRLVFANPDETILSFQQSCDNGSTWFTLKQDNGTSGHFDEVAPAPEGGLTALHAVDPTNVTGFYYSVDARWSGSPGAR